MRIVLFDSCIVPPGKVVKKRLTLLMKISMDFDMIFS